MHLTIPLLTLLPLTTALQSIYLGTFTPPGKQTIQGTYIAWFSDSPPCSAGVRFGQVSRGFGYCTEQLTLLGHPNITFSGCNTGMHASSYPNNPTGVNDAGTPALTCAAAKNPESAPEYAMGRFVTCEGVNAGVVDVIEYCA